MKIRGEEIYYHKEHEWETVAEGVSRQITGYDQSIMMVKVKFEKGAIGAAHQHYHSQTTYVASGKFDLQIDGGSKIIETGDCFYMAPNKVHGVVCLEAGMLIDVFSPVREDFL